MTTYFTCVKVIVSGKRNGKEIKGFMSFGKRLKNAATGYVSGGPAGAVIGAALPTGSGSRSLYNASYTKYQKQGLGLSDKAAVDTLNSLRDSIQPGSTYMNALKDLPDNLDIAAYYNNPFRESTKHLLSNPINRKFNLDQQQLTNDLNATNQLGSSYAALRENQLQQNYNQDLQTADLQAVKASADAYEALLAQKQERIKLYQQHYNNLLNQLSGYQDYYRTIRNQGASSSTNQRR
jgi:hypothetical protein